MPQLQQGAKALGKKALQTGVQDVLDGDHVKTAVSKRAKQALGNMTSQNSSQSGSGQKATCTKRKVPGTKISSPPSKRVKASLQPKKTVDLSDFFQ